ncbi:class I SAM-dependent methyltransferase [Chloroflexota bacterium]
MKTLRNLWALLKSFDPLQLLRIIGDWKSMTRVHYLYAAIDSGLLDALPASRDELISRLDVSRLEMLDALLNVGLSIKELKVKRNVYSIKGKRSKSMLGRSSDVLRALVEANVTYYASSYRNFNERMRGATKGDELKVSGDVIARLSELGAPLIRLFVKDLVKGGDVVRILEVGCGEGIYLKAAYDANPNATGIGVDIDPDVVDHAKRNIKNWVISDRFSVICGDIFNPPPELSGKYDLITLYNIVYYFDEKMRMALFSLLKEMLARGGALAITSSTYDPGSDVFSANLNMATSSMQGLSPLPGVDDLMLQLMRVGFGNVKAERIMRGSSEYGIVAR